MPTRCTAEWARAGIEPDQATGSGLVEPADTDHGVRTFAVVDPSGNEIRLGPGPH